MEIVQKRAFLLGGIALLLGIPGMIMRTEAFFRCYLFAYVFWIGFPLGCLAVLMLHHLVSGRWGYAVQRIMEAGAETMPLMALLFIPVLFGLGALFPWVHGQGADGALESRGWDAYLNPRFFVVRAAVYFGIWITAGTWLSKWSRNQDQTADPLLARKMRLLSAPGLILYALATTFASIDWVMSLEPGWSSTIFGLIFVVGQVLSALAFAIIALRVLRKLPPLSSVLTTTHFHHLGNLLLAFVILWAYVAYSQFIIIWSGNLPDENIWYIHRSGGWAGLAIVVIIAHFFVPFLLLLSRRTKRAIGILSTIAAGILVMHLADVYWIIMPSFYPGTVHIQWLDITMPLGIGGLWFGAFVARLRGKPLLALHDPRFPVMAERARTGTP